MVAFGQEQAIRADGPRPPKPASAYPSRQAPAKEHPLGRRLMVVNAIRARLVDPTIPAELRLALPGFADAVKVDEELSVPDMLQALVGLGALCVEHLVEPGGDDVNGRFCTNCEFELPSIRYRGHAEIPFPMGEVIDQRDLHADGEFHDKPGAFA